MKFTDYADKAISRFGLTGYNNLAREIGIKKSSMSRLRSGLAYPTEENMIKISELAGTPKEQALIDLNLWRSQKDPARHAVWQRIAKMIVPALFFALFINDLIIAESIANVSAECILCIKSAFVFTVFSIIYVITFSMYEKNLINFNYLLKVQK